MKPNDWIIGMAAIRAAVNVVGQAWNCPHDERVQMVGHLIATTHKVYGYPGVFYLCGIVASNAVPRDWKGADKIDLVIPPHEPDCDCDRDNDDVALTMGQFLVAMARNDHDMAFAIFQARVPADWTPGGLDTRPLTWMWGLISTSINTIVDRASRGG